MRLYTAEHLGFCFGVRNAVDMAEKAVTDGRCAGAPVYSVGSIIHNRQVVAALERAGLITETNIESLPFGAFVVVRSHGEGKSFFERASEKNVSIIDATCPKVRHIHEIVKEAFDAGNKIIIVGNPIHPEVRGINGWCAETATVVETPAEAREFVEQSGKDSDGMEVTLVSQTTFEADLLADIISVISALPNTSIHNTICSATEKRRKAADELAQNMDAMLVIGDKASSNTRKLYEISKKRCKNTFFAENAMNLPLHELTNCNKIGITAGASTPDGIIKEVITRMKQFNNEANENNPMFEYMEEIDKALKLPRNGDIVTGEVIQVSDQDVIVNLGCKKDGVIPRGEVTLEADQTLFDVFSEGDEVQAKVLKTDDGDGNILLSKKRVIISEHWEDINAALEDRTNLEVTLVKEVSGGVIAYMGEISGFIPMSQISDRYIETAAEHIGQTLPVKVMRVDQKRNKVVFSHKAVLNEERQKRMMEIWDTINVGDIIDGKVMRFTEYGAFVDIGGIDGLLHISEISWGKLRHPGEMLELNQEIKVKVLSMNKEKEKISLGYKQNMPEPWSIINEKFSVGQVIRGKAVQIKDYGVFVELEPGLDGLVHISEIAHRRVGSISEEITLGQEVSAKILEIDRDRRRISLSIRETLDAEDESLYKAEETEAAPVEPTEDEPAAEAAPEEVTAEETEVAPVEATEAAPEEAAADETEVAPVEATEDEPAAEAAPEEAAAEETEAAPVEATEETAAEAAPEEAAAEETEAAPVEAAEDKAAEETAEAESAE